MQRIEIILEDTYGESINSIPNHQGLTKTSLFASKAIVKWDKGQGNTLTQSGVVISWVGTSQVEGELTDEQKARIDAFSD